MIERQEVTHTYHIYIPAHVHTHAHARTHTALCLFFNKAYGSGGYARYKETTAKFREYANDILAVHGNGVDSVVTTVWQCTASCCTSKGRWCGRKDEFAAHQKRHIGGNATFLKSGSSTKSRQASVYCSLCTSAPLMRLMNATDMQRHLTQTFGQVFQSVGQ